ncbi:MAG: hypothetical protein KDE09_19800 [Anaerolineales bacterium]|nr:hypothetical protein [Anaerolineales bacterium]MCB0013710.1 hypothetical protein [Anaerolineales bacterium]MCB0020049.1 hypothetical protein [Anaerolineales bacterium]MCB8962226.1 hypothetical protein [Ardenticatenales bacterium]
MVHKEKLLIRLEEIGQAVAATGRCLALLGLGSVGQERDRLDEYSDLDFFVITRPGETAPMLQDLSWLTNIYPVTYYFRNTVDGYKFLYADDIFCEFAVFPIDGLDGVGFAPGQLVWQHADFDHSILKPTTGRSLSRLERDPQWQLGEALTNLYVGLGRYCRGEKLSAFRFIQHYAVDRLLMLTAEIMIPESGREDPFTPERRFEQRFPALKVNLPDLMPGYDYSPAAAGAILTFLEQHFPVNPGMSTAIRQKIEIARHL